MAKCLLREGLVEVETDIDVCSTPESSSCLSLREPTYMLIEERQNHALEIEFGAFGIGVTFEPILVDGKVPQNARTVIV